jgi:ABC-type hemin transport system ATPase subunit
MGMLCGEVGALCGSCYRMSTDRYEHTKQAIIGKAPSREEQGERVGFALTVASSIELGLRAKSAGRKLVPDKRIKYLFPRS